MSVAAAREDTRPLAPRQLRDLLRQARLPDPGLADDHDERSIARLCPVEEANHPRHLLRAADERCGGEESRRLLGVVLDLDDADRLGEALERLGAKVMEAERAATGEESRDGARAEDLTGLGRVAEPARGDDGGAKVAAARAPHDLADVEADADAQALAVDRPPGALLHRDRAAHRIGG
jgi:hypothetical protein